MSYQCGCDYQFKNLLGQELSVNQGGQGWARCPFCKSNKFAFNTIDQVWFCHGCKKSGHISKLAMLLMSRRLSKGEENV